MSGQAPGTSKDRESRKRLPSPDVALAAAPTKQPRRGLPLRSLSLQPKKHVAAAIRQRTLAPNRTPTPRPCTPVVKAEVDDGGMPFVLPGPVRSLDTRPAPADQVAERQGHRPRVVVKVRVIGPSVAASDGAAHTGETVSTLRPWTPEVKAEVDDGSMSPALSGPEGSLGRRPTLADQVAEPEGNRAHAARQPVASGDGATNTGEAADRENDVEGNVDGEPPQAAADAQAPAEIPADNDAGEDVPENHGGAGAEEDFDEGHLRFDGPWDFKYRGRRFLYVQGSKHEGRLVQCETCGDQFLVGVYKENKQRTACANDEIDAHACFYEDNAGELAGQEPKDPVTPALEGFKAMMTPDGSIAFRDAQCLYEYNELRSKKSKHDATRDSAGPSGSCD